MKNIKWVAFVIITLWLMQVFGAYLERNNDFPNMSWDSIDTTIGEFNKKIFQKKVEFQSREDQHYSLTKVSFVKYNDTHFSGEDLKLIDYQVIQLGYKKIKVEKNGESIFKYEYKKDNETVLIRYDMSDNTILLIVRRECTRFESIWWYLESLKK